jgi:flagellar hook-associated protein 3 FlgL
MRATLGTTYRILQTQINRMGNRLNDLRQIAASGKKLNKPSDDPSAVRPVLNAQALLRANDRYLKTMGTALDRFNNLEDHFEHMENLLVGAYETTISSLNGTYTAENRENLANTISQIKGELLDTANAKFDGKYVFAGFEEQTKPFTVNDSYDPLTYDQANSLTWPVQYNGDTNIMSLEISPGELVEAGISGNALFLGDADNDGAVDAGRYDIFAVLTRIEDAMRADDTDAIEAEVANLQNGTDQIRLERGTIGNNIAKVDRAMGNLQDVQISLQETLSRYEDADIIEAITNMTKQENAYEAALQVAAQASQLSILDYL